MQESFGNQTALAPSPGTGARAFAFGKAAKPFASVPCWFVSFFDLIRPERCEDRPPVTMSLVKLSVWLVAGVAVTSATAVGLGAIAFRFWTAAF
jgi:hypothetical protein